jgi:hypothetical protein
MAEYDEGSAAAQATVTVNLNGSPEDKQFTLAVKSKSMRRSEE